MTLLLMIHAFERPPRHLSTLHHLFQHLTISERVHSPPEALILVGHEMSAFNQAIERLKDQFFAIANEIEDFVSEYEEAAINPDPCLLTRSKSHNGILAVEFGKM